MRTDDSPAGDQPREPGLDSETARRMGSARSPAKRRAAQENGKRGGWKKGSPKSEATKRKTSATKTLQMLRRVLGSPPEAAPDDRPRSTVSQGMLRRHVQEGPLSFRKAG
ncbi:hypothetical protein [Capsulimonas corticalis]|uniref:hypothetical protein n=1 Tax=Capsulimonas corticalis TaxID=2219043 RepID=UPI000F6555A2|nr:hypothetical protein [Capsulimonas corticalis]